MVINKTSVYCPQCAVLHGATIEKQGNEIVGNVACPIAARRVVLSDDADIFLSIRQRSGMRDVPRSKGVCASVQNFLIVTNSCNCRCPVCFAKAGDSAPFFMPPEEAYSLGMKLKKAGGTRIGLLGGEPTVHPQLFKIIRTLRSLGLTVVMPSNGLVIADDPQYVKALKKSGLSKVDLQFDTFDEETHLKLRGNTHIQKKLRAGRAIVNAGLELGICTTVIGSNLHEVPLIVEHWIPFAPALNSFAFQVAACTGRYDLPIEKNLYREQVIRALCKVKTRPAINAGDFWPLPAFEPWNLRVHPDCAANLYLAVNGEVRTPLGALADIGKIQAGFAQNNMRQNFFSQVVVPLVHIVKAGRQGARLELLSALAGVSLRRGKKGIVLIGVGSFLNEEFRDEQRLACCPTSIVRRDGLVSPCRHYR